ncbi:MAG: hypothetical protein ABGZ53_33715 [Fuerstiella sp.]
MRHRRSPYRLVSYQPPKRAQLRPDQNARTKKRATELLAEVSGSDEALPIAWDNVLKNKRFSSDALLTAVGRLHDVKKYESAIEGIQSALRNDQAQTWMYDVLAMEMKLAGRPQKQIDRVLLSRIDFAAGNEAQMLVTASYMARFGAYDQAIAICREAAKRNPWQPTTWGLARRIADGSQNPEAIIWSRVGTIRHVWTDSFEAEHAEAMTVLRDLERNMTAAGNPQMASNVRRAMQSANARDLRIRVSWVGDADIDLDVIEPNGQRCSRKSRLTSNGGMLIRQSDGSKQGRHTEEYVCVEALSGEYEIRIRYILGRVITGRVKVEVIRYQNTDHEKTMSLATEVVEHDATIKVQIERGRGAAQK